MVIIRQLKFNEWIRPLQLSAQILGHTPQPQKFLLLLKLPISLLLLKLYDSETIYVAEDEEKIIGICLAQIKDNQLLIEGTVITEDYRRRGISNQLKNAVEKRAVQLGATSSVTKIEPDNIPAINMAKSQGYHKVDEEKRYKKGLTS
jgi:ribosomal protein S18 acetylase RimI-like enzyme